MSKSIANQDIKFVFFGTSEMSVMALDEMLALELVPTLVITAPDARAGRGRVLTPPPVKLWAESNGIDVLQPAKLDESFLEELSNTEWDLFVVFAYGKILPKDLLNIPQKGTLNIHPSMLPLLRGPSPVRSAILHNLIDAVGVSIIELDEKMDHGPIVAQAKIEPDPWPVEGDILDELLSREGGKLLAEVAGEYLRGSIIPEEQNHDKATYCHFFKKTDGLINLKDPGGENYRKYCALKGWPGTYFFDESGKRIKITDADLNQNGEFVIKKVIPEGKKEQDYLQ